MTNATEELRRLLDELGVEWRDESNGYVNVTTFTVGGIEWNAIAKHYINRELDCMRLRSDESITPERVVAATLVSETSSSEADNPQIRCTDSKRNAPVRDREDSHTLLPCPFCGGEAEITGKSIGAYAVGCSDYDGCIGFWNSCNYYATEAEAIEAWNTRTASGDDFSRAVHDGHLWRMVKDHIRCRYCGLNIESVIALEGCNKHAIKHCPNCGRRVIDDRQGE